MAWNAIDYHSAGFAVQNNIGVAAAVGAEPDRADILLAVYFFSVHDGGCVVAAPGRVSDVFTIGAKSDRDRLDVIAGRVLDSVDDDGFLAGAMCDVSDSFAIRTEDRGTDRD